MMLSELRILTERRDYILCRLSVISEAPAQWGFHERPGSPIRQAPAKSAPPPGVNLNRVRSQRECPDKDRSLFDFYAWHFAHVVRVEELVTLCFLAERDLGRRLRTGESTAARHRGRDVSIVDSKYFGQPAPVVAAVEECSEAHVKRVRREAGLDPKDGRGVPHHVPNGAQR